MVSVTDLFTFTEISAEAHNGYLRLQSHPLFKQYVILNYTDKATYEKRWTKVTTNCRGLIVDLGTTDIIARPFPKFFNLGEHEGMFGPLDRDAPVQVYDKIDGSLGILYFLPNGTPAIATRGSFNSEQAIHASNVYLKNYHEKWNPNPDYTYLFEIVYPQNRIVLDYGDVDDLVFLGAVHKGDGTIIDTATSWPGKRALEFKKPEGWDYTLDEVMNFRTRPNAEGVVVRLRGTNTLVKIKQDDYVALHKVIFGLSEHSIWELMKEGKTEAEIVSPLPDELQEWAAKTYQKYKSQFSMRKNSATLTFRNATQWVSANNGGRKEFALHVANTIIPVEYRPLMFGLYDKKPIDHIIWKQLEPRRDTFARISSGETDLAA